jgi:nitroreductase
MELRDAIRTMGSVRQFTPEPVDDATVHAILDDARFAPSGGNRQGWRVVVLKDPSKRSEIGRLMHAVWNDYVAVGAAGLRAFSPVNTPEQEEREAEAIRSATVAPHPMLEGILDVPVVLVVAADLSHIAMMDRDLDRKPITGGASIYPFCWNLLLAARSRGLGGVITTFLSRAEHDAAPILGLPPTWALAATIFLGHPVHQPTKLKRNPVEDFAFVDRFDGPAFNV